MPLNYSLYFHVPFCTKKCAYCHFYVIPDKEPFKEIYLEALEKEWRIREPLLKKVKGTPLSIYLGGGTPSLLRPDSVGKILSWIPFEKGCEITLEANPEDVTSEKIRAFASVGVNRVSLGVQTFDDFLLKGLSRTHSSAEALAAIDAVREAGICNLSIDLMYDLPNQDEESWRKTLDLALSLPITHLSLYNLTIEPHTSFFKRRRELSLPSPEASLGFLQLALEKLQRHGFERYELSAFSKGKEYTSLHNTGYWIGRPFLGFGPSAWSYWEGVRFRNQANLHRYAKKVANQEDPRDFEERLPFEEGFREHLAIGLRRMEGVEITQYPPFIEDRLKALQEEGWLERVGPRLRLTDKGALFHDTVAEKLFEF